MHAHLARARALTILLAATAVAPAHAATIGVVGNVSWQPTPGGGHATRLNGTGIVVDNSLNPIVRIDVAVVASQGDHLGVSHVVCNTASPEAWAKGYFFDYVNPEGRAGMYRAASGFNNYGIPSSHITSAPAYDTPQPSIPPANYSGGWGFTQNGLPHWGQTNSPGQVSGSGDGLPLTWSGDLNPFIPGIQSFGRMGVGIGANVGPADDPNLAGQTLGFGADVANGIGGGGGEWWFHSLLLDTTGWDRQTYHFYFDPSAGNVLRINDTNGNPIDYSLPRDGGFREAVTGANLIGGSIQFTLVPEPGVIGFTVLGALALTRRRTPVAAACQAVACGSGRYSTPAARAITRPASWLSDTVARSKGVAPHRS